MPTTAILLLGLLSLVAPMPSQSDVSGRWTVTVEASGAHADMTATLQLAQTSGNVTGTLSAHGNEHTVSGTFKDGGLELTTTDTPADRALALKGRLQADGSLAGFLSGPAGDMKWKAIREKGGQ